MPQSPTDPCTHTDQTLFPRRPDIHWRDSLSTYHDDPDEPPPPGAAGPPLLIEAAMLVGLLALAILALAVLAVVHWWPWH